MNNSHSTRRHVFDRFASNKLRSVRFLPSYHHAEKGVVLFMALIALVAMTMAALALVHSVGTTNLVASNVVLKEGAAQEADIAMNIAFHCLDRNGALMLTPGLLQNNQTTCNYFANLQSSTTPPYGVPDVLKTATPAAFGLPSNPNPNTGNNSYYVIERLCTQSTVAWSEASCVLSPFGKRATFTDEHLLKLPLPAQQALYRITVRVSGSRGVTAYSQMIVNAAI